MPTSSNFCSKLSRSLLYSIDSWMAEMHSNTPVLKPTISNVRRLPIALGAASVKGLCGEMGLNVPPFCPPRGSVIPERELALSAHGG